MPAAPATIRNSKASYFDTDRPLLPLIGTVVLTCVLMGMTVRMAQRSAKSGSGVPGWRVAQIVAVAAATLVLLLYVIGVVDIFVSVRDIARYEKTTFRSARGVRNFCIELQLLAQQHFFQMVVLLTVLYLILQTFCIPGTVVLNAALGAVCGVLVGVPFCTLLGTLGACSCYCLSYFVGTSLVEAVDRRLMDGAGLPKIRHQVQKNRGDLLVYMLFLRLTPILPNWLVNLASPVVGVPASVFAVGTFFGILPQTYLMVRFGAVARLSPRRQREFLADRERLYTPKESSGGASEVDDGGGIVSVWDTLLLAVVGIALLAGFRLKRKFASEGGDASGRGAGEKHTNV